MSFPSTSSKYFSESFPLRLNKRVATGLTKVRSELMLFATPGYRILTASFLPLFIAL